jgi:hypothetical protein
MSPHLSRPICVHSWQQVFLVPSISNTRPEILTFFILRWFSESLWAKRCIQSHCNCYSTIPRGSQFSSDYSNSLRPWGPTNDECHSQNREIKGRDYAWRIAIRTPAKSRVYEVTKLNDFLREKRNNWWHEIQCRARTKTKRRVYTQRKIIRRGLFDRGYRHCSNKRLQWLAWVRWHLGRASSKI